MPEGSGTSEYATMTVQLRASGHGLLGEQLLAEGRSNKEVASLLDLGLSTVETHRGNMMQKLNLHNTAEIVLYAVRKGIIV